MQLSNITFTKNPPMKKRSIIRGCASIVLLMCLALSNSPATVAIDTSDVKTEQEDTQGHLQVLTLNDLRDVGILLHDIKQQAINVYREASRARLDSNASAEVPVIKSIPQDNVSTKLLPARRQWVLFFLGTMEPVIRQLNEQSTGIDEGSKQLVMPSPLKETLEPLWNVWSDNVKKMNGHLDDLLALVDDAPNNNSKIQNVAVYIFNDTQKLDAVRADIFKIVQASTKKNPDAKILISPL
jgi:hypothetical protein